MGVACSIPKQRKTADGSGLKSNKRFDTVRSFRKANKGEVSDQYLNSPEKDDSGELRFSFPCQIIPCTPPRKSGDTRKRSFLGKVRIAAGIEKAVEVLDAVGSGVANMNTNSGAFASGLTVKGNKISILAFEVANTITKGANLMQSLSEENVCHVKQTIFSSDGVHCLVSTDTKVLLSIAAADIREELYLFCREVIRFGDLCKDPQWHNLHRFFSKLESDTTSCRLRREDAEQKMHGLTVLAQHTAELYHELNALDRFEHECRQKLEESESLSLPYHESVMMLQTELKHQKKLVMSLKRKSLWSKRMEEVIEKLVDVAAFIHHQISESFVNIDSVEVDKEPNKNPERLGAAGLAVHYAKIVSQIDNIASRPSCLPPNTRDSLYRGLPTSLKNALPGTLRRLEPKEELSVPQIKAEMEKTLEWLVPMATNTTKMYQGFGWVGEWAITSNDYHKQNASTGNLFRLQTLYHADKQRTDNYILELVMWLHRLISAAKQHDHGLIRTSQINRTSSPICTGKQRCPPPGDAKPIKVELSQEERSLLETLSEMQSLPIVSKSQKFTIINRRSFKMKASFRSSESSPTTEFSRREAELIDESFDVEVLKQLDLAI